MRSNIGVVFVSDRYGTFPRQSVPFNCSLSSDICSLSSNELNPFVYIIHSKDMRSMPARILSFSRELELFSRKFEKTYFFISSGYNEVVNGIDKSWADRYLSDIYRVAEFFQFETVIINPKVSSKMTKSMKANLSCLQKSVYEFASRELVERIDVEVRFLDGNLSDKSSRQLSKKISEYIIEDRGIKKKEPRIIKDKVRGKRIIVGTPRVVEDKKLNVESADKAAPTNGFKRPIKKQNQKPEPKSRNKRRRKISKTPEVIIFGR